MLDVKLYELLINLKSNEECGVVCIGKENNCFGIDYGDGLGLYCVESEEEYKLFKKTGNMIEIDVK